MSSPKRIYLISVKEKKKPKKPFPINSVEHSYLILPKSSWLAVAELLWYFDDDWLKTFRHGYQCHPLQFLDTPWPVSRYPLHECLGKNVAERS